MSKLHSYYEAAILSAKVAAVFWMMSCMHLPGKSQRMTFDKQGHRGCRSLMPENTIPAMLKAIDLGVTTLEMDIVITSDNQAILSHEPFFNHEITTKPDGEWVGEKEEKALNIYRMAYTKVQSYDVGTKPHPRFPKQQKMAVHKPLLTDVIDAAEEHCRQKGMAPMQYNIETKTAAATDGIYHPAPDKFIEILVGIILKKEITKRVTIQSFDIRTLLYAHQRYPSIKTALLIEEGETRSLNEQFATLGFTPAVYSPHFSLVSKALLSHCHDKKVRVIPWTVNDLEKIKALKIMGVDGIITDDPGLFHQL